MCNMDGDSLVKQTFNPSEEIAEPTSGPFKYRIDPKTIQLTESPLDDYQRTVFATLLSQNQPIDISIADISYKSNLIEKIRNLPYASSLYNKERQNTTNKLSTKHPSEETLPKEKRDKSKHMKKILRCSEYLLPDICSCEENNKGGKHTIDLCDSLDSDTRRHLALKPNTPQILMGDVELDIEERTEPSSYKNNVVGNKTQTEVTHEDSEGNNPSGYTNGLKSDNVQSHAKIARKLINPNNGIILSAETSYVFLTGIWRLYEDIMFGLLHINRHGNTPNSTAQAVCRRELDIVLHNILFSSRTSASRKEKGTQFNSIKDSASFQSSTKSDYPLGAGQYDEFHWANFPLSLRQHLFDQYMDKIIHFDGVPKKLTTFVEDMDIIHRVRGGFTHIQGTWAPVEVARSLCSMFCFPIRYFLVPIFGPDFPSDCEQQFLSRHDEMLFINKLSYSSAIPQNSSVRGYDGSIQKPPTHHPKPLKIKQLYKFPRRQSKSFYWENEFEKSKGRSPVKDSSNKASLSSKDIKNNSMTTISSKDERSIPTSLRPLDRTVYSQETFRPHGISETNPYQNAPQSTYAPFFYSQEQQILHYQPQVYGSVGLSPQQSSCNPGVYPLFSEEPVNTVQSTPVQCFPMAGRQHGWHHQENLMPVTMPTLLVQPNNNQTINMAAANPYPQTMPNISGSGAFMGNILPPIMYSPNRVECQSRCRPPIHTVNHAALRIPVAVPPLEAIRTYGVENHPRHFNYAMGSRPPFEANRTAKIGSQNPVLEDCSEHHKFRDS
ncbi:uncharacterized protein KNAG_0E01970 [Huiozyma naganishii CBS 8797]|uniref:HTH APSES-type domain-containing protein n=1 Tax=Huiozyma naganishii (strain ATCC MYA-139 / BCRC 22969 / CBS 8797 / KCTC 17520 / NBRC 10181 / NCYC 3082 / Yp74L-3) TaxID=1071383 RepID=J7S6M4_HUIN7|nr:hypothetical protein KNAG_0E01970 [Kazachstania naganishii CBS 8797]CCK70459.1 hypothetical protein KNAG_0E01970 [Kazachstania naganishii CBS 8797]